MPQALLAQATVAFAAAHLLAHLLQLFTSLVEFDSQPFCALPSQSLNGAVHIPMAHALFTHDWLAFASAHFMPQAPQLLASPVVAISHPLAGFLSQSPKPWLQVPTVQTLLMHARCPLKTLGQGALQAPQL